MASPYVGGDQTIVVTSAQVASGTLTMTLAWAAPPSVAQAVNTSGTSLVKSYGIFYRRAPQASPPGATGDKAGWTRVSDTDGSQTGGYSLNTSATVAVALGGSADDVYLAIGPNFDGGGNPDSDTNCKTSQYISKPVLAYRPGGTAPTLGSLKPRFGPTAGGTSLVVHGSGFATGTALHLGGAFATGVGVDAPTTLRATSGPHGAGVVDVTVVRPGGLSATLMQGFTYTDLPGTALNLDRHSGSGTTGNLNGVLEPGEHVVVEPAWTNWTGSAVTLTGTATSLTGPSGATYALGDTSAGYGSIAAGAERGCHEASGDCYQAAVSLPSVRPSLHWDVSLVELLSSGQTRTWTLHVGDSFADAPPTHWAYAFVEAILHAGITTGCNPAARQYCPSDNVSRDQMAVFLARGLAGGDAQVPSAGSVPDAGDYDCRVGGVSQFTDVGAGDWFCRHAHYLWAAGITRGCDPANRKYCPAEVVPRDQMAVFMARIRAGNDASVPSSYSDAGTGRSYDCQVPGGTFFSDVDHAHWACRYVHYLWALGQIGGCDPANHLYCPSPPVHRDEMAKFLAGGFGISINEYLSLGNRAEKLIQGSGAAWGGMHTAMARELGGRERPAQPTAAAGAR